MRRPSCQWRFRAGAGGTAPKKIVARPPNLDVLLTHCGQLILRKISKFDAARCQILRLKCTKFDFCWDSAPDPAEGAFSALSDHLAVFKGGGYFSGDGEERGRGGEGQGKMRGNGEKERDQPPNILA